MSECSVYNTLRLEKNLCDAVIRVEQEEFHVHKVLLVNGSSYFGSLFTRWSSPNDRQFDVSDVTPHLMKLIIEFIYTGFVPLTMDNVKDLFIAADRFDVRDLLKACNKFLEAHLEPQNCIGIWCFSDIYYSKELNHKSFLFTLTHFEEVAATSEEFLQLSIQEVAKIIKSDKLTVKQEKTVFEAIMRWITYAPDDRRECVSQILSMVRLAFLNPTYIMEILNQPAVMQFSEECQPILLKAMEAMLDIQTIPFSNCIYFNPLARPRVPTEILLAFGGWSGRSPTYSMDAYDVCANRWVNISQHANTPRAYHGTVYLSGSVYCVGGYNDIFPFSTVDRFDLDTLTWHEVAPMNSSRCYVSVTVLDGYIYALGGYDGTSRLDTAERYDPQTNQWTYIASMHNQRSDASCAVVNGKIYICGGFNGRDCMSSAECYCPRVNQWTMINPMSEMRSGIGVIASGSYIYAVGGFNGNDRLRTVEAFDTDFNTWHDVPSMLTPRSNFGIEVMNGCIYVIGGYNGSCTTMDAECFDIEAGRWSDIRSMEISRSALSCCVVKGLKNMEDYAVSRYSPSPSNEEVDEENF